MSLEPQGNVVYENLKWALEMFFSVFAAHYMSKTAIFGQKNGAPLGVGM